MASLSISLFGSFDVCRNGKPVDMLRLEKAQALLAYLAAERRNVHRREMMATLLWPEATEDHGRANLRQLLHRLKVALDDFDEDHPLLQLSSQHIHLASGTAISVDVTTFTDLLNACKTHPHAANAACEDCLGKMREAAALYRGEFLADWHLPESALYQEWVTLKQAELHNMAVATFSFLAHWYEQHADYEGADAYLQQQLRAEPWSEVAHRQRMQILAAKGKRISALKQYVYCSRILAEELSVEPSWETKRLYQHIAQDLPREQTNCEEATHHRLVSLYSAADGAITQARFFLAAEYVEQLMALAQHHDSADMIWLAKGLAGINNFFRGDLQQARWHLEQVITADAGERSRHLRLVTGPDFYATCLHWLSWTLYILGRYRQAQECAAQAIAQAEDHPPSRAFLKVLTHIAACCLDPCLEGACGSMEWEGLATGAGNVFPQPWRNLMDVFAGTSQKCMRYSNLGAATVIAHESGGQDLARLLHDLVQAELCMCEDNAPALLVTISHALALAEETGANVLIAELQRLRGQALLHLAVQQGGGSELGHSLAREAEVSLRIAVDFAHAQHMPLWELRATRTLCRYYQQSGREREAVPLLMAICDRSPIHDPSPDVAKSLLLLHSLGAPVGEPATLSPG